MKRRHNVSEISLYSKLIINDQGQCKDTFVIMNWAISARSKFHVDSKEHTLYSGFYNRAGYGLKLITNLLAIPKYLTDILYYNL